MDTQKDPHELTSMYGKEEYSGTIVRLKQALEDMKEKYQVPPGIPAPRVMDDPYRYASSNRRAMQQEQSNAR
jgi:hypothetical protein